MFAHPTRSGYPKYSGWSQAVAPAKVGCMTITDLTRTRVDLFTDIHKGLRKGLFDLSVQAGTTDWDDPHMVNALGNEWTSMVELLRCHTTHENDYIFSLLPATSDIAPNDDHRDLDDLLDDLDTRWTQLRRRPDTHAALAWYRDLNRYIALTLEHLHLEETVVLPALWSARTDDELTDCRTAFIAETPPAVLATTMSLLRGALPPATQRAMGLAH